jgi:CYTH domain-containing protein
MKNIEIERKFQVDPDKWSKEPKPAGILYHQGYLCIDDQKVIRVRTAGSIGFFTIKGSSESFSRPEFEYEIPLDSAKQLLELFAKYHVEKIRYKIFYKGHIWDVDEFLGDNEGLIMAEVELSTFEEFVELPEWIREEVTQDPKYYNSNLAQLPYKKWK